MIQRLFALAAICTLALCSSQVAYARPPVAPPFIFADTMTVAAGGTGTVTVYLQNPLAGTSFNLAAFNVTLSIDGAAGVTFTGLSEGTPYVFSGNSFGIASGGTLPMTNSTDWSDLTASGTKTIANDGISRSLGELTFTVSNAATPGFYGWSIVTANDGTMLVDGSANSISFVVQNLGSLTVTGGGVVVPEPASVVLFGLGGLATGIHRRRKAA